MGCKMRRKKVAKVGIYCKKAYDMVLQSWILDCLKMFKISNEVLKFILKAMKKLESRNWVQEEKA